MSDKKCKINIDKTNNISEYLEKNKLSLLSISQNDIEDEEEYQNIKQLNDIFKKSNVYKRIKFNDTFKCNIRLLRNKKDIEEIIKQFEAIEKVENLIENLEFKKEFDEIEEEIKAINRKIIILDRTKISNNISQNEFLDKMKNEFDNVNLINVSGKEIINFYFFIYLLKNNLYDEKSFKHTFFTNNY